MDDRLLIDEISNIAILSIADLLATEVVGWGRFEHARTQSEKGELRAEVFEMDNG